jgi:serine phosphatase RsbU (regulator of sigma subunit)
MADQPLAVGGVSRPCPGETANGDAWTVEWHDGACRIAVIDGLGHGPAAMEAAQRARDVLRAHRDLAPGEALRACHAALHGTRGAVISIARIAVDTAQVLYAGIGNVEAQLWQRESGRTLRLVAQRGIVGVTMPTPRCAVYTLEGDWLLLLHTDGVSARFHVERVSEIASPTPAVLAAAVLKGWGRDTDDATVVVARPRSA